MLRRRKAKLSEQGSENCATELEADHTKIDFSSGMMGGFTKVEVSGSQLVSLHELPSPGQRDLSDRCELPSSTDILIHEMES